VSELDIAARSGDAVAVFVLLLVVVVLVIRGIATPPADNRGGRECVRAQSDEGRDVTDAKKMHNGEVDVDVDVRAADSSAARKCEGHFRLGFDRTVSLT
jgi:hypothetical protein